MKIALAIGLLSVLVLATACETTGDPRQGGLFGWSETKARQRQEVRRREVAAVEADLAREQGRTSQLAARDEAASRRLSKVEARVRDERERVAEKIRQREAAVLAKASALENESPTAATASRARSHRARLNAVLANRSLSAADRNRQIREIEAEIDEARANLSR